MKEKQKHICNRSIDTRNVQRLRKVFSLLVFSLVFNLVAVASVQVKGGKLTINEADKPVKEILQKIESQSDYKFFYNEGLVNVERKVTLKIKNATINAVLDKLFLGTNVKYRMDESSIVLYTAAQPTQSKGTKKVKGVVVDTSGEPVPGVNVIPKSDSKGGVITDLDGNFSIDLNTPNETLIFSFIGFKKQEVAVGGKSQLTVTLAEESVVLDEVVAIGYGVAKKSSITGSITSVKAKDLPKAANVSVNNMLSGKASGVQVLQTSAQPGGGVSIVIRGAGSDKAGNEPLYVIDGFPVNNSSVEPTEGDYSVGKRDPLNSINPNDIESIEILKDAASTAIYGARAANGVVLITTKRGREGRTNVDFSYTGSVQQVGRYFDMLDAKGFMEYSNILGKEQYLISSNMYPYGPLEQNFSGYKPLYKAKEIAEAGKGTDWWDEVTRLGNVHDVNLSISGGSNKTNFLISANYFNQKGLVVNSEFERFTARLNLDHKITDNLKVGVSATGSYIDNGNVQLGEAQWQASGVLVAALQMSPVAPIYDATGSYYINPKDATLPNPVSYREIDDNTIQKRLLANAYAEYSPIKNLTFKTNVGIDNKSGLRSSYLPTTFLHGAAANGKATKEIKNNMDLLFNLTANYNVVFNKKHSLGVLVGYEYQEFGYDGFSALASNIFTDAFGSNNLGAAEGTPTVKSYKSRNTLASYFARMSYNYNEKYIAGLTLRRDGSSNFGSGNKWGFFPSIALAWRVIQEDFMQPLDFISNLKLRTSFGQTGNSGIGDRAYAYYGPTEFPYMFGDAIVVPANKTQLPNSKLKWETTTEFNIGLDYGFLQNRISGSIEYYNKVVSDLLAYRTLPIYSELRTVADNIGSTQLSGFEFELHTVNLDGKFKWKTDFNISTYTDRWRKRNPDVVLNPWQGVHDPIRSLYGYQTEGIVQVGQDVPHMEGELPGNLIYKDVNGFDENHQLTGKPDGKINDADIVFLGSTDPGFTFGFGNTFEYKGFDLNIFFYGMGDRVLMNSNKNKYLLDAQRLPSSDCNMMTDVSKLFLSTKPSNSYPGIAPNPYQGNSDYLIEDASFIRLKNVTLGYTFPKKLFNNKLNMRVYVDAQNLFLITGYSGVDPEMDSLGAYPNAKTFSFGISLGF